MLPTSARIHRERCQDQIVAPTGDVRATSARIHRERCQDSVGHDDLRKPSLARIHGEATALPRQGSGNEQGRLL